jgi:type I site-specific restriction-modification system R (restriction) subunit
MGLTNDYLKQYNRTDKRKITTKDLTKVMDDVLFTLRELTQRLSQTSSSLGAYIEYKKDVDKFSKYVDKKYEDAKKDYEKKMDSDKLRSDNKEDSSE